MIFAKCLQRDETDNEGDDDDQRAGGGWDK